jgi:Family of unknown function (DUF6252)
MKINYQASAKMIGKLAMATILVLAINACKKADGIPTLNQVTGTGGSIKPTEVTIQSNVLSDGGNKITEKGFCYGKNPKPTTADSKALDGSTSANPNDKTILSTIKGLKANTKYYFRSFATNSKGTGYSSSDLEVTTPSYSMTAFVDNNAYTATVFDAGVSNSRYYFETQTTSAAIIIYLPEFNVTTGTFSMTKNGSYDAKYSNGVTTYSLKSGTGSITITESSSSGKVKGLFSFTAEDPLNPSAPTKVITLGTFETYR